MPVIHPYRGGESFIFVSYSHKDKDAVQQLLSGLIAQNVRIWYDEGIDPGTEWDANIATHIEQCDGFIAFISQNYIDSENCKDELNYARDLGRERLLVYLERVNLPSGMAMRMNRIQAIHRYTYADDAEFYAKLCEAPMLSRNKDGGRREPRSENRMSAPESIAWTINQPRTSAQQTSARTADENRWIPSQAPRVPIREPAESNELWLDGRRFTNLEQIAMGYASTIYRAFDVQEGRVVVIKKYADEAVEKLAIFKNWDLKCALVALSHVNLCPIVGIVIDGAPYIVMTYMVGRTLSEEMREGPCSYERMLRLMLDILYGLDALHEKHICYRNVTSTNVMIVDGRAVLCDFSEADFDRYVYEYDMTVHVYATRSPERKNRGMVDCRSDIYEAGALMQQMYRGWCARDGQEATPRANRRRLFAANEEKCAQKIEEICTRAMKYEPSDRYQSVGEMIAEVIEAFRLLG